MMLLGEVTYSQHIYIYNNVMVGPHFYTRNRRAPMWQQSGTLQFCSCHGIAGFLVHELEI